MKLEKQFIDKCYHDAAILQYKSSLMNIGFNVEIEKSFNIDNLSFRADLYAYNENEQRIYEIKLIGKNNYQEGQNTKFKEIAERINAKPFIVYVSPPTEKQIDIDDIELEEIIYDYLINNIPSELDTLSTHTSIDSIYIIEINGIEISKDSLVIKGDATISVELQYGSDGDCVRGNGLEYSDDFPMEFVITLDYKWYTTDFQYSIDTSGWYE